MVLSNKTYDVLKNVVQVILPGLATLYAGLATLWHFPEVTEVVGSITLLATFLGLVLKLSTRKYNQTEGAPDAPDGDLFVSEVDGEKFMSLGVNKSVEHLTSKDAVVLRVVHYTPENSTDASQ